MRPADRAWLALGIGIIIWDMCGPETLSSASQRYAKAQPHLTLTFVGYLAAHLLGFIPQRIDPLHLLFGWRQR